METLPLVPGAELAVRQHTGLGARQYEDSIMRPGAYPIISAPILGTAAAIDTFRERGGALVETKRLWQGIDIEKAERLRLVWINELPVTDDRGVGIRLVAEAAMRPEG
jgi:hypothetical protein